MSGSFVDMLNCADLQSRRACERRFEKQDIRRERDRNKLTKRKLSHWPGFLFSLFIICCLQSSVIHSFVCNNHSIEPENRATHCDCVCIQVKTVRPIFWDALRSYFIFLWIFFLILFRTFFFTKAVYDFIYHPIFLFFCINLIIK